MTQLLLKRRFWFWTLTVATATTLGILSFCRPRESGDPKTGFPIKAFGNDMKVYGQIPAFQLTEANAQAVSLKDLEGKIWIADFIFTRCAGICPLMSGNMKRIQEKFKGREDIRLVSFSVDPEYDTPERLTEYAKRFSADPAQWIFLTGDKNQIHRLSQQHFHLAVLDIPEAEREALDQAVDHSSKFVLVDGTGQIRGYYASDEPGLMDKLVKDIERLEKQKVPGSSE